MKSLLIPKTHASWAEIVFLMNRHLVHDQKPSHEC